MKKITSCLMQSIHLLLFLGLLIGTRPVLAQCSSSCNAADCISTDDKNWLVKNGYSLVNTYTYSLSAGSSDYTWRTMYGNGDYVLMARAETGVTDLDLWLYDSDGTTALASKTESGDDGYAHVTYEPYYNRNMKIKVKNHAARCSSCSYNICVFVYFRTR